MDNEKSFIQNEITYDEGWQSVSTPEYAQTVTYENADVENSEDDSSAITLKPKKKRKTPRQLLIIIQLAVCLLVCIFAYVIKNFGGELYTAVHSWYETELNSQLVSEGKLSSIDFSEILKGNATNDET